MVYKVMQMLIWVGALVAAAWATPTGDRVEVRQEGSNPHYASAFMAAGLHGQFAFPDELGMLGINADLHGVFLAKKYAIEVRGLFPLMDGLMVESQLSTPATEPRYLMPGVVNRREISVGGLFYTSKKVSMPLLPWSYSSSHIGANLIVVRAVNYPTKVSYTRGVRGGFYQLSLPVLASSAQGGVMTATNAAGELRYFTNRRAFSPATPDTGEAIIQVLNTGIFVGYQSITRVGTTLYIKPEGTNNVFKREAYSTSSRYIDFLFTPAQSISGIEFQNQLWNPAIGSAPGQLDLRNWGLRMGFWDYDLKGLALFYGMELFAHPGLAVYGFNMNIGLGRTMRPQKSPKVNDFRYQEQMQEALDKFRAPSDAGDLESKVLKPSEI